MEIRTAARLAEVLAEPMPPAWVEGLFGRAPGMRCWLGGCTLGEVCGWSVGPAALRWRGGVAVHDPEAADWARLRAVVWRDAGGSPLFDHDVPPPEALPAGVVDRLLLAADAASGYRPPEPDQPARDAGERPCTGSAAASSLGPEAGPRPVGGPPPAAAETPAAAGAVPGLPGVLTQYAATASEGIAGLLPQAPEAVLWVRGYRFAGLASAEAACWVELPGGGPVRVDVLAWPRLLADAVRCGPEPEAPALLDEALARRLPYGAARALIERADRLSELGGPLPGVRFQRPATGSGLGRAGALAPGAHRPLPL